MQDFVLYHTLGCHLCEEAEQILKTLAIPFRHVDIADDEDLVDRYGIRIPVLHELQSGDEIGWPFDEKTVLAFIRHFKGDHG